MNFVTRLPSLVGSYADRFIELAKKYERLEELPYDDGEGIATIGIGINITGPTQKAYLALVLKELGVFTESDQRVTEPETEAQRNVRYNQIINTFAAIIKKHTPLHRDTNTEPAGTSETEVALQRELNAALVAHHVDREFRLLETEADHINRLIIEGYEIGSDLDGNGIGFMKDEGKTKRLDSRLSSYGITLAHDSHEFLALTSLFFNVEALVGKGLRTAMSTGNRAEAWYEIRYGSNGNDLPGIAKRRYAEAAIFGLYEDKASVALDAAEFTYQMLQLHRDQILGYESRWSANIAAANSDYSLSADYMVGTLEESLNPAKNAVIGWIAADYGWSLNPELYSSTNIFWDPGRKASTETVNGNYNGLLDTRNRNASELLVGAGGNDDLYSGLGDDVLIGGAGDDTLSGGAGADTYIFARDEGVDTIVGADDQDIIAVEGTKLDSASSVPIGTYPGRYAWEWQNDGKTFQAMLLDGDLTSGGTLLIKGDADGDGSLDAGAIVVRGFQQNDLGLHLPDTSAPWWSEGVSPNLGGAPLLSTGIVESHARTLTLSIGLPAAEDRQLLVSADGPAETLSLTNGDATVPFVDGQVLLTIPRGQSQVTFSIWARGNVDVDQDIHLTATLQPRLDGTDGGASATLTLNYDARIEGTTTLTINGDLRIRDSDPGQPGVQVTYDSLGNRVTDPVVEPVEDILNGSAGADTIIGGALGDILYGRAGDDVLFAEAEISVNTAIAQGATGVGVLDMIALSGASGDNLIAGEAGDDTLIGGTTDDLLAGGEGGDLLVGGHGDDCLVGDQDYYAAGRNWTLTETLSAVTFAGADATGVLYRTPGDDVIYAGGGNDLVFAQGGDDQVLGEAGDDNLRGGAGRDTILGGDGDDQIAGDTDFVQIYNPQNDADDFLDGGLGNDRVEGNGGADVLYGGDGDDELIGDSDDAYAGNDFLDGEAGADTLRGEAGADTLFGGDGNDQLYGDSTSNAPDKQGDDYLDGEAGDDLLIGAGGRDSLFGGAGNDQLQGDSASTPDAIQLADYLSGGAGNDQLFGFGGDDFLDGGDDDDTLQGGSGNDTLSGGNGTDTLIGDDPSGPQGDDGLRGGLGDDTLHGMGGDDRLFGDDGSDVLTGGDGNDILDGGDGDDWDGEGLKGLWGGAGNDLLRGGLGKDRLQGGGDDDTLEGGEGDDLLFGEDGADQLFGEAGSDTLLGGAGDDVLEGGNGDDYSAADGSVGLFGEAGNDVLRGGAGKDRLQGGDGDDVLVGGGGDDILFGEAGNDQFVLNAGDGHVQITDTEGANRIVFGSGVSSSDIQVELSGGYVLLHYTATDYAFMDQATFNTFGDFANEGGDVLDAWDTFEPGPVVYGGIQLRPSVNPQDVSYHAWGDDLVIAYDGAITDWVNTGVLAGRGVMHRTGDGEAYGLSAGSKVLVLTNWYRAADSISMSIEDYVYWLEDSTGQAVADFRMVALNLPRTFAGTSGDDVITGSGTSDVMSGGAGSDSVAGQSGDDDLSGGGGDDLLEGGGGNDTYRFGAGDGIDLIIDSGGTDDLVRFGAGITPSGLTVSETLAGLDVVVGDPANGDQMLIVDWAQGSAGSIDRFIFDDGTSLNRAQIDALNTGNHSPRVAAAIGEQLARVGQAFSYAVPAGTFTDQDTGDALTYVATQADGTALPTWLSFNPSTRTFSGTPASGDAGLMPVRVQVTDSGGLTNSIEFDIRATTAIVLTGTSSSNTLTASTAANYELYGLGGDDTLTGNSGNDRLEGGTGSDALNAAAGSDTYVYARGDGSDTINQNDSSAGKVDTLLFRTGIVASDLVFASETDGDLAIYVRNVDGTVPSTPSLTITGGLIAEGNEKKLDQIIFEDEPTVLTLAQIEQLAMTPTENADYLRGSSTVADTIAGLGGNDLIFGLNDNDTLDGGAGADTVDGGAGNDVLTGGLGNDTLTGGAGSDTYVIARGDGNDTIPATLDADPLSIEAVQFGTGVQPGDVRVTRSGATLTLRVLDPTTGAEANSVSVFSGFDETLGSQILDEVRFADAPGTVWTRADLQAKSLIGTGSAETLIGFSTADVLLGNGGNDYLQGGAGNDDLSGGAGNDQLNGDTGDDTYRFGRNQGYDEILDSGGTNRIVLDAGIAASDVSFYRTSSLGLLTSSQEATAFDDLVLILDGGRDQIRIEGFYNGQTPRPIASVEFADGTVWNAAAIDSRVTNPGGTANTQTGNNQNNSFTVDHPNDVVSESAYAGTDTITSTVSFTLPTNVENLTLSGPLHINGTGNASSNVITGNALDNVLNGLAEDDQLYGQAGNDTFLYIDDDSVDSLYGGTGDDTYYIGFEYSTLSGGVPNDEVYENAGEGYDTVYTKSFEYTMAANVEAVIFQDVPDPWSGNVSSWDIVGNGLDNYIDARLADKSLSANFVINGGAGADTIFVVNGGVNRVVVDNVGDVVNGADGNDTIVSSISYTLAAGVGNLELTGSAASAGTGNALGNQINGSNSTGANMLTGGTGNDVYTIGSGDSVVESADEGTDTVIAAFAAAGGNVHSLATHAHVENLTVAAAAGAATLIGTSGNNSLTGNSSANVLDGAAGDDTLTGGAGNDRYVGFGAGSGHDVLVDSTGTDLIEFDTAANTSIGQIAISRTGNDLLLTRDAQSSVRVQSWFAAGGANIVESLVLQDAGLSYTYTAAQLQATANGVNGGPAVNAPVADQALDLDVSYSFQLAANAFTDVESQSSLTYAATLIDGSALPSWLAFDALARTFTGTPTSNDAAVLEVRVTATDGGGLAATEDFLLDVGHLRQLGTASDDTLTGNSGINWIYGLEGHDSIDGQAGNDHLSGDAGDDALTGGAGQDTLLGGRDSDVLTGGADADQLQGGIGGDTYVFDASSGQDTIVESDGIDRIEFANGSGIVLSSLAASRTGDDLVLTFGANSVTVAGHYTSAANKIDEFVTYQSGVPYTYSAAQIEALVTGTNSAPYVGTPLRSLAARANVNWSYQVPANTFTDTQSQGALTYTARQAGGAALPSWLTFTTSTRTLSGKPPNNTNLDYSFEIVATDPSGLSTVAPLTLHVRSGLTTWTGTASSDSNAGTTGLDYQLGLAGDDTLSGNSGDDIQDGADGNDTLNGQAGVDTLYGGAGNDVIDGGDGNDTLYGEVGRDTLTGGIGADALRGGSGADTLTGGTGNDTLVGGEGEDTYRYASGDATDTIDNSSNDAETDRLQFTNIARTQLTFTRSSNDLVITRAGSDSVRVTNWFSAAGNRIDEILTSDGQTTTADQIDALIAGGGSVFSSSIVEGPSEEVSSEEGPKLIYELSTEASSEAAVAQSTLWDDSLVMPRGRKGWRREGGARSEGLRIKLRGQRLAFDGGNLTHTTKLTDRPGSMTRDAWIDRSLGQLITAMASFNDLGSAETADSWHRDHSLRREDFFGTTSRPSHGGAHEV